MQVVDAIRKSLPYRVQRQSRQHVATRTFQALRIFANNELEELKRGLQGAARVLSPGGVLCVVAYHSLEDRISKEFMSTEPTLELKRPKETPRASEVESNVRARSAIMRIAVKKE